MSAKQLFYHIYGFAIVLSAALLIYVGYSKGLQAFLTVLVLAILEVTFSFDNAIINAKILKHMSRAWQTVFMTLGIAIAVFVVRVFLPIVIVSLTSSVGFGEVVRLVLHNPTEYSEKLEAARPIIALFGGMFLLLLFLDFIFEHRPIKWFKSLETFFVRVGKLKNATVTVAVLVLLGVVFGLVEPASRLHALIAGVIGLETYLLIHALSNITSPESKASSSAKLGLAGFLYLELIDASFSLDGVIGAFAITKSVLLIAVGLGIGALFVRSMTVHLLRKGVLGKYKYLEHGAHYAIGLLAVLMLVSVKYDIPEFITGGIGLVVIVSAILHSHLEARVHNAKPLF